MKKLLTGERREAVLRDYVPKLDGHDFLGVVRQLLDQFPPEKIFTEEEVDIFYRSLGEALAGAVKTYSAQFALGQWVINGGLTAFRDRLFEDV